MNAFMPPDERKVSIIGSQRGAGRCTIVGRSRQKSIIACDKGTPYLAEGGGLLKFLGSGGCVVCRRGHAPGEMRPP